MFSSYVEFHTLDEVYKAMILIVIRNVLYCRGRTPVSVQFVELLQHVL